MGRIGDGYGSECHLLRYLGRHRKLLDQRVRSATGATEVEWLDAPFAAANPWNDGEWLGTDFLPADSKARKAWGEFWPQRGNPPNWDAVGRAKVSGNWEWLLVEAKAHTSEMKSSCKASEGGGLPKIRAALEATKKALGVPSQADWLNGYYQFCNRIAHLHFLMNNDEPARLLFVYFCGDRFPSGRFDCPKTDRDWELALKAQEVGVALPRSHPLCDRVHKVFLSIDGAETSTRGER